MVITIIRVYKKNREGRCIFSHTKLLRESFLVAKSTSTNPANDGLYKLLVKEELLKNEKQN